MILNVPFYVQGINECGPVTLQMVLEYLGERYDKEKIKQLIDSDSSGTTWTLDLAKAAAQIGFKTEFYTTFLGFNPKNFELEYYQKNTDGLKKSEEKTERLYSECAKYNVEMKEKSFTIKEITSKISKDCIPIVLLDWGKIDDAGKFIGHFVPIVGYDKDNIYVHNPGPKDPQQNYPIKRGLFDTARKALGTDEDIIFIHRKLNK